ncbi:type IV conjugative transfer system lipoprotein TraV [Thiotrichales bacterium 19S11-10]|nr:type IV conjugative transfer system lipoprotein TraV [Thiotrichales bacterium 19S11-10]
MRYFLFIATATIGLLLTGCSMMNNQFDCNKVSGISGCISLDEVNHMSDYGQLPQENTYKSDEKLEPTSANITHSISGYLNGIPNIGEPVRYGDQIEQITIFPYEDSDGNYHEASIIYTVLKKSHWIAHPPIQVQTNDDEV